MDVLELARLQLAVTTSLHWLFVLLTLGLAPLVAVLQTRAVLARDPARSALLERMTKFWGQIYVINYVVGIVTGLVMEFQFGLNWSGLTHFVGNVFGAPLALETLVAFFAESTFLGMWIFGWGRLPRKIHLSLIWLVTLTAYASAYWILVANGFLQHPVGYEIRDGVAYLTDFGALLGNASTWYALVHITGGALLIGGMLLAGVSAYHLVRHTREQEFFRRSLRLGVGTAAIFGWFGSSAGHAQEDFVREIQPMKFADAAEGARLQAQLAATHGPGDYTPPAWIDAAFFLMFPLGEFLVFLMLIYAVLLIRGWIFRRRLMLRLLVALIPLPFVIAVGGWVFREVGRQPWVVYEVQGVHEAVSQVSVGTVAGSFVAFTVLLATLAVVNWTLIVRFARRGPEGTQLGAADTPREAEEPVPATL
ncbi:MAG: cytochrome ubiquinol oxidase subunit I [Streptosporangiales bacterium]|nr:cytochrome ubiquinol oxidase subunit I [Streptosporangiales bacterium]